MSVRYAELPTVATLTLSLFCFATVFTMYTKGVLLPFLVRMTIASIFMGVLWIFAYFKTDFGVGVSYIIFIAGIFGFFIGDMVAPRLGYSILPLDVLTEGVVGTITFGGMTARLIDWLTLGFVLSVGTIALISLFRKKPELTVS